MVPRRDFVSTLAVGVAVLPFRNFAAEPALRLPETIRIGLIGLEGHVSDITVAAKTFPNVRFTAISDTNENRLKSAGRSAVYADATTYSDWRKLLANEKLDIVGVCGDNGSRAEILQACAKCVPAIISEKPLALSLRELAEVRRAIERRNAALTMLLIESRVWFMAFSAPPITLVIAVLIALMAPTMAAQSMNWPCAVLFVVTNKPTTRAAPRRNAKPSITGFV